ncbi:mandelate racemase/muconate lactonizing enzyme family protein [Paludibaculum fermentans]|uniref:mandelate racemase/muconate lactonizing enzyme family protein n=1 Tax=Paludibaculum fermentans TaxID=1473598 RepID=UPI003EB8DDF1
MNPDSIRRRNMLAMGAGALLNPGTAAAQAVGVKAGDLPDLTVKEVKVYVVDPGQPGTAVTNAGYARIAAVVTNSGLEGNYTLARRYWHPNWSNEGWLDFAKRTLVGRSVLDLPALTSQYEPPKRRLGQSSYASAIDACLWDILGKAVGLPIYRILGAYRNRVMAYASSQHHKTVEEFVNEVRQCKADGFKAYKIHPPSMPDGGSDLKLDLEVCKAVRAAAGDDFILLMDPVGVYTREQAMIVGRLLEKLNYVAFEDPIPTTDIEGLVQLCQALDIPVHIGEFLFSPYNYADYIRRGAMDVVRFITDNVGGITGGMKIARLAECFGMECAPHNWGETFDHAVHFHCELAMPNNVWFEMTVPQGVGDRPYIKDRIRIAKDGYVDAPVKPGLGYEIDRAVLDRLTKSIER